MTPLAREHAEKLAQEDRIKAANAAATRLRNVRAWKRHDLHVGDLTRPAPKPRQSRYVTEDRRCGTPATPRACTIVKQMKREKKVQLVLQRLALFTEPAKCKEVADACDLEERCTRIYLHDLCHRGLAVAVYEPKGLDGRQPRLLGYQVAKPEEATS